MKSPALYFGNRFAAAPVKSRKSRAAATMEMEPLENRILLSGIGTGLEKKSVIFNDADGDLVKVSMTGGKDATFDIDLGGADNNADIANIQINGNGSLSIVVTPVGSLSRPSAVFAAGAAWDVTPGYTNVGSITAKAGVAAIGSIGLTAAVVDDIDLGSATVNNLSLNTGKVAMVDSVMSRNTGTFSANLGIIDFHDITAGKINQISLAGSATGVNDFEGDITVANGIGRISGSHSMINGQILVAGAVSTVGNIVTSGSGPGSGLSVTGDLTLNAAGFQGSIDVGGHLNLGITGGSAFTGTIHATGGISGIKASTTDAISITGADVNGQIITDGDMGGLVFTNSDVDHGSFVAAKIGAIMIGNKGGANVITASTFEAGTIGVITSYSGGLGTNNSFLADALGGIVIRNDNLDKTNAIEVTNALGNIDISNGSMDAMISAGSAGNISILHGNFTGTVSADTTVGTITVTAGQFDGTVVAGGNIAAISANWLDHVVAGDGITAGAVIHSDGTIGSIVGTSVNGNGINGSSITAGGAITTLAGTSYHGGAGITALVPVAASIATISGTSSDGFGILNSTFTADAGTIGSITGTGFTGGISGVTANSATDIGAVMGKATATGDGILNSNFNALGGQVTSVAGSTVSTAATGAGLDTVGISASGNIGPVSGSAFAGAGISSGSFLSTQGNIGAITGASSSITGAVTSHGIAGTVVNANGSVASISGTAGGSGDGLNGINVNGQTTVGAISGTSLNGNAISGGTITGASVGAISATVKGTTGATSGITGGITVTAVAGDIGAITVTDASTGTGITGGTYRATGNIGAINVTSVGIGISVGTYTADSDLNNAGDIISISATVSGAGNDGINGATFKGANIGPVTATLTAVTGAGDGIDTVTFTALTKVETAPLSGRFNNTGMIGAITVTNASTDTAADGIVGSSFSAGAAGSIGAVNVTTLGGDGIVNTPFFANNLTGTDTLFTSTIGAVTIRAADIGASNGDFTANAGIGAIQVNSGEYGIAVGSSFLGDVNSDGTGNIVSVSVTTKEAGFDAINSSSFTAANIGTITVNQTAATGFGDGLDTATFTAVTNTDDGTGKFNNLGTIGTITVTTASSAASWGINGSSFNAGAGGGIGAITVTTQTSSAIVGSTFYAANTTGTDTKLDSTIGAIQVLGAGTGIASGTFSSISSIGAISSTGTGSQAFTLNTDTVGTLSFNSLANGSTVTATVNTATSIGSVSVSNPTPGVSGNFTLVGGAALTKLNNITVDGNATLPNLASVTQVGAVQVDGKLTLGGLAAVTKFTSLTAGSLNNPVGNIAIGNAAAVGTTIGAITVTADPVGNLANRYVFNFDSYTATPDATIGGATYTAVVAPGTTTAAGGITLILA